LNIKQDNRRPVLQAGLIGRRQTMTLGRTLLALTSLVFAACSINAVSDSPTGGAAGTGPSVGGSGGETAQHGGTGGEPGTGGSGSGGEGGPGTGGSSQTGGSHSGGAQGTGGAAPSTGGAPGQGGSVASKDAGSPASGGAVGPDAGTKSDTGTTGVSYSKDIQPFLNKNCTSCHGSSSPTAGIDLSTYTKVKSNATRANSAIQGGAMPPGGGISAADKQMFQSWVSQGAQNN
jgi:hypothetical protein